MSSGDKKSALKPGFFDLGEFFLTFTTDQKEFQYARKIQFDLLC